MEIFTTESFRQTKKMNLGAPTADEHIRIRAELGAEADICLRHPLYSVTYSETRAVSGDPHDYYSEGPYWWPDPKNPGGPFIRRDGEVYPGRIDKHGSDMSKMINDVYILSVAGAMLGRGECTARADKLLRTWFLDAETKMNPHLEYAQAIFGHCTGRGIGIIDTVMLIKLIAAMEFFTMCPDTESTTDGIKEWFAAYLNWMDTSKNGIEERDYVNNHAAWWNAQAASYAAFIGDKVMLGKCFDRFVNVTIPSQQAEDGSFPLEIKRTKSYSYSMYNLDACAVTCEVAHHHGVDLWNKVCADGKGMAKALDFMFPYYEDPSLWNHQQIVSISNGPSLSFILGAVRVSDKYAEAAKRGCKGLRYFAEGVGIGSPCMIEGCV